MSLPVAFALQLHGEAVPLGGGRFWVETRGRMDGAQSALIEAEASGGAVCRRDLEVWEDGSLLETGELRFGDGSAFTFRARGALGTSPDPTRRHGTAVLEVTGGSGRFGGVRGYVTSNFLLSDTGELTDHHLGLLFLAEPSVDRTGGHT
jgi:hypothetical protein